MIIDDFLITPEFYIPDNKIEFSVGFSFNIGPKDTDASEIFNVRTSNKCLQKNIVYSDGDILFRKGCIELEYYDYNKIVNAIKKYIDNIDYDTWNEVETELTKVFLGEFENYQQALE